MAGVKLRWTLAIAWADVAYCLSLVVIAAFIGFVLYLEWLSRV